MNLAALEAASSWANMFVVAFGLMAAVAAAFALYFSARASEAKDSALEKYKADAAATVALADARAAEATEAAAKANERAGTLEKETAGLKATAESERLARVELEARVSPRRLPAKQQQALAEAVARYVRPDLQVAFSSLSADLEARVLGAQIVKALQTAGINTMDGLGGVMPTGGGGPPPIGIMVSGPDSERGFINAFAQSLKASGLLVSVTVKPEAARVFVFVGMKPIE
jgi:hypothetical protein